MWATRWETIPGTFPHVKGSETRRTRCRLEKDLSRLELGLYSNHLKIEHESHIIW